MLLQIACVEKRINFTLLQGIYMTDLILVHGVPFAGCGYGVVKAMKRPEYLPVIGHQGSGIVWPCFDVEIHGIHLLLVGTRLQIYITIINVI